MLHSRVELWLQASEDFGGQQQSEVWVERRGVRINEGVVGIGGGTGSGGESDLATHGFVSESGDEASVVVKIGTGISIPVCSSSETVEEAEGVHHLVCNFKAAAFNDSFEKLSLGPEEKQAFDAGFQSVVLISGIADLVVVLFGIKEVEKLVGVGLEAVREGDIFAVLAFS
ncbi:hypothetical protein Moror_14899 [Moniliophthora roreri MCA 2997]|uniref:Uncharacterized protein n=1 Tax=Moniliophthora roreri (strain MCA 2997) TaxID=1381753 RepID=V2WTJ6_MONRO|nr:hypothetical protein Moror_14899 [Moniliophthora roreri MCA 2997]